MNRIKLFALTAVAGAGLIQAANAALLPYPTPGFENTASYSFTATTTGDIGGYYAIQTRTASYDEDVTLLVNGVATGAGFGLPNSSALGTFFNFGHANAGDVLTFILRITAPPSAIGTVSSNPSDNAAYDGGVGHQHVYSGHYNFGDGLGSIPSGTYVGFEDLPAGISDWNYHDDAFVFINTTVVPEPTTMVAGAMLLLPFGLSAVRVMRNRKA